MFSLFADRSPIKKYSRLNDWCNLSVGDMKIFIGHIFLMGLVKKSKIAKYWHRSNYTLTPYFGKDLSRNRFQSILANLHLTNKNLEKKRGERGYDPLYKVRPIVELCNRKFMQLYRPGRDISFDEACCAFKGKKFFRQLVQTPRNPQNST